MTKELDLTKPLQTRDGRKVRLLCDDFKDDLPLVFAVTNEGGNEFMARRPLAVAGYKSDNDIINVPATRDVWVNVYSTDTGLISMQGVGTKRIADSDAAGDRVACQKITLVEGQFDEE